ncbi:MAG: hypothetical protein WA771_10305 [Chthoniobacterales bacterium]
MKITSHVFRKPTIFLTAIAFTTATLPAEDVDKRTAKRAAEFTTADVDGDDFMSKDEMKALRSNFDDDKLETAFNMNDKDDDGLISKEEWMSAGKPSAAKATNAEAAEQVDSDADE